jgi:two-component system response regulator VicR
MASSAGRSVSSRFAALRVAQALRNRSIVRRAGPAVLVVDDDADWRDLVADTLTEEGFIVATASDGRSACDCVRRAKPEVVVTDVEMPFMNGYELFAHLRCLDRDLPVIVMSAGRARDARSLGEAFRFIPKPATTDAVTAAVQEALLCRRRTPLGQLWSAARAARDAARQRGWVRRAGSITVIAGVATAAILLMAAMRGPAA